MVRWLQYILLSVSKGGYLRLQLYYSTSDARPYFAWLGGTYNRIQQMAQHVNLHSCCMTPQGAFEGETALMAHANNNIHYESG